jgi:hypothetical protein
MGWGLVGWVVCFWLTYVLLGNFIWNFVLFRGVFSSMDLSLSSLRGDFKVMKGDSRPIDFVSLVFSFSKTYRYLSFKYFISLAIIYIYTVSLNS